MSVSEDHIRRRISEVRLSFGGVQDLLIIADDIDRYQDVIVSRGSVDPTTKQSYDRLTREFYDLVGMVRSQLESEKERLHGDLGQKRTQIEGAEKEFGYETEKIEVRHAIDEDFDTRRYTESMNELRRKYSPVEKWKTELQPMDKRLKDIDVQMGQLVMLKVPPLVIPTITIPAAGAPPAQPAEEAPKVVSHLEWVPSGEFYIVKIPVQNNDEYLITDARVALRIPDGLEIIDPKGRDMIRLGTIEPGKFGTATFRLVPERCVYGTVRGHITYIDARNRPHIIDLEEREVSGVCPLLTSEGVDVKEIIGRLEEGDLMNTNQESLNFRGDPRAVYGVLLNCVGRLKCVENDPKTIGDNFIGRALCVGKAPGTMEAQVKPDIVVETNVTGIVSSGRGTLTLVAHSDSGAILTPFFVDIMRNVRQHVEVIGTGERLELLVQKCPNCGTPIDLTQKTEDGIVHCRSCRYPVRLPKYGVEAPTPAPTPPPAQANRCPQCGHENEPGARFCVKCGNRL